jgi:type I restriction enzyme S subunit
VVEQKAILEKLSAMFAICKTWRSQREQAEKLSALLAAASVSALAGIRIEKEEELKAPKTELISKLRIGEIPGIKEQAPLATILARQNGEMASKDLWQRFGGEIDVFYTQLKLEVSRGWILEPAIAEMREVKVD